MLYVGILPSLKAAEKMNLISESNQGNGQLIAGGSRANLVSVLGSRQQNDGDSAVPEISLVFKVSKMT